MGISDILEGTSLTMRQVGIIIVGWLLFVCLVSIALLIYTRFTVL